jgi:hypothetical protein
MMSESAKHRLNMFCAWGGFWYLGVVMLGWALVAGFLPPHQPSAGATEITSIIRASVTRIRIGMVLTMVSAAFCMTFIAIMARYIARIEGGAGVLTYGMIMGGIGNVMLTFYPAIFWLVAAFRPDRSPEIIYVLNDWAWIELVGGATIFWPMPLTMAYAALSDTSADPVFPRWSGYAALWMFFLILPDQLVFFFQTGPFAWNGLFGIWLPLIAFCGWFAMSSTLMVKAMKRGVYPDSK